MRFCSSRSRPMRMLMLGVVALTCSSASLPVRAQTTPTPNVQAAYETALKCFVVAGNAYTDRRDAKDQERATYFDGEAKHDWDVALRLSKQLGYSSDRFEADAKAIMDRELPMMVKDPAYFRRAADECKAYGLL